MRPTTQYSLTRISTNISGDQLGIYLLPLCHTHPVPTGRCKWFKHIRCCGFSHFGATVAVGEGQDLVNLEDPSVQVTENKNTAKASMLFYPIGTHDRALIFKFKSVIVFVYSTALYCASRITQNPVLSSIQWRIIQIQDVYLGTSMHYMSA